MPFFANILLKMEESWTYQAIVEKGRVKGARRILLHLGTARFGAPPAWIEANVAAVQDGDALEGLCFRLLEVASWEELFTPPSLGIPPPTEPGPPAR
jgi:hypothetical protein